MLGFDTWLGKLGTQTPSAQPQPGLDEKATVSVKDKFVKPSKKLVSVKYAVKQLTTE